MLAGIEVSAHLLTLELLQRLCSQVGLRMEAVRICPLLGFAGPALNSKAKSYLPFLSSVNGVFPSATLPEVGVMLVKLLP
jgi:hypothetical protein